MIAIFRKTLLLLTLLLSVGSLCAQNTDFSAKIRTAVQQMDSGLYAESEALLREVIASDNQNFDAWYELAFLYSLKKDHAEAMKTALKAAKMPGARDIAYQLAGTSADYMGDPVKAVSLYKQGLKKFPDSGRLLLELGNMAFNSQQYVDALDYFERGVVAEPTYPSNYRNIIPILKNSSEPIWALLYGEIFMNLERSGDRMKEMSRTLYAIYKGALSIENNDGKRTVKYNFTHNKNITIGKGGLKIPFPIIYELAVEQSLPKSAETIDLETLNQMRCRFITEFFDESDHSPRYFRTYPNALFDFHRRIAEAGHMEAYNYWILGWGDEAAYDAWIEAHEAQWNTFIEWFEKNPMPVNKKSFFQRHLYDNVN